ncbi:malonyl-CoA O-methyltransferase [Stenotrophomonas koreensis]|uniref:Malonyl-[acyl-carrier protein] O-methyltransferase n=1 Tax=Stenotrophomonas koreensis TaxID=266128 RepID=A0A0R0BV69_9GAMM|nr:malonyl-ACP O-methyltransferase BioC [Stenotrophomonas koreensis]KRG57591.1 malonyl-CoA O-methyltransferase [Stenotrophomonas koreensis]
MTLLDPLQIRRHFGQAAAGFDDVAVLAREAGKRLFESLDYLDDRQPEVILEVGCGTGHNAALLKKRWPRARVIALDSALPMLRQAKAQAGWWKPFQRVAGDAAQLPLADASVDLLVSNLCLPFVNDLADTLAGFRRVLKPDGLLLCSTYGSETLGELDYAFAQADTLPHVHPFAPIASFGDALMRAGFRDPVIDRDLFTLTYPDLPALMAELRALGYANARSDRRRTLTGRGRFAAATRAYEALRQADGRLPSTWEVLYAHAWAPAAGTPIRQQGQDIAAVPLSAIPIRRRQP